MTVRPRIRSLAHGLGLLGIGIALTSCNGGTPTTPLAPAGAHDLASFQAQFDQLPQAKKDALAAAYDKAFATAKDPSHVDFGEYRLHMNLKTGEYRLEAVRQARFGQDVVDVTSLLTNPACPNSQCVNFVINNRDAGTGQTDFTIFIYNPSVTKVYDTRFIWTDLQDNDLTTTGDLNTLNDVTILNPQGWTNEFDDAGAIPVMTAGPTDYTAFTTILDRTSQYWPAINPFNTIASNQSDQSLAGKVSAFTQVSAIVKSDTTDVTFRVTASVPGQRQDPVQYKSVTQVGLMDDNLNGKAKIVAVIDDHQNNIGYTTPPDPDPTHLAVELTCPQIYQGSASDIIQMVKTAPGTYETTLTNWTKVKPGKYDFYIRAHSDVNLLTQPVNYDLYWRGQIIVVRDPSGGGGGSPAPANTIAYVSSEFGDNDIILDKIGGGSKSNLNGINDVTELGADDIDPSFSTPYIYPTVPPGSTKRWIAWASDRGGSGNYRIFIWDLNPKGALHTVWPTTGGRPIAVTSSLDNCLAPDWSPDNKWIVCQCKPAGGRWEIRKYPINIDLTNASAPTIGAKVTLTRTNTGDNTSPAYSRDGSYIAFDSTRVRADNPEIYVMNSGGENVMLNRITYRVGEDRDPVWASGAGFDQILFQAKTGAHWQIMAATFAGNIYAFPPIPQASITLGTVTSSTGDDVTPAVSPDGRTMIFASNRTNGDFDIWTANAAIGGGGDTRRTTNTDDQRRPDWGLDTIAF